jgi:hypothetical protein
MSGSNGTWNRTGNISDPRAGQVYRGTVRAGPVAATLAIADSVFSRKYKIYAFSIAPPVTDYENYWIAWGGRSTTRQIQGSKFTWISF